MGNYEQLKQAVSAVIKANGNQKITGDILKNTLLSIISTIGSNATFAGVATPHTNPGTPDQNVYYFASTPGVYPNFGSITVGENVAILSNSNGTWNMLETGIASDTTSLKNRAVLSLITGYLNAYSVDGYLIQNKTGDVSKNDSFSYLIIAVYPGMKITFSKTPSNQIHFYDKYFNHLSYSAPFLNVTVPNDCYYIKISNIPSNEIRLNTSICDLLQQIEQNSNNAIEQVVFINALFKNTYNNVEIAASEDGKYIAQNGNITTGAGAQYTTPISLKKGQTIVFTSKGNAAMSAICVLIETYLGETPRTFYVNVVASSAETKMRYYTAEVDCNVILSYITSEVHEAVIIDGYMTEIYRKNMSFIHKFTLSANGTCRVPITKGTRYRLKVNGNSDMVYTISRETTGYPISEGSANNWRVYNSGIDYYIKSKENIRQLFLSFNPTLSQAVEIEIEILEDKESEINEETTILDFGDSISDSISTTVGINLIQKYTRFIQLETACNIIDNARWGTGFLQNNSADDGCLSLRIEQNKSVQADYVLCAIGINDYINNSKYALGEIGSEVFDSDDPYNESNNLCGAIDYCFAKLIEYWGNKSKIFIILPLPCFTAVTGNSGQVNCLKNNSMGFNLKDLTEKIKYYAIKYGIPYLDMFEQSGFYVNNPDFRLNNTYTGFVSTGDGLHPMSKWHKEVYAKKVLDFMNNL